MISKLALYGAIAAVVAAVGIFAIKSWTDSVRDAAVAEERRERMDDAIDLIRTTDKALGVARKATDADLCRALGGKTVDGVCQ
jgi:hypothetical protein